MLPALERRHDVLAPTLLGHAGGPPLHGPVTAATIPDAVERAMDGAGFATAHLVGNSLGDDAYRRTAARFATLQKQMRAAAPHAGAIVATAAGRRQATRLITERHEQIPAALLAHQISGAASCTGATAMIEFAMREGYDLDAERIACPVRIIWGLADRLLHWPAAAARFRDDWLAHADWVQLDGVGHCPQLDVPLETAQLILGFTAR